MNYEKEILQKMYADNEKFSEMKVTFAEFAKDRSNNSCK